MPNIWIEKSPAGFLEVWIGRHAARRYATISECRTFIFDYYEKNSWPNPALIAEQVISEYRTKL